VKNPSEIFMLMDSRHVISHDPPYGQFVIYSPYRRIGIGWTLDIDTDGDGVKDTYSVWATEPDMYYNGANFRHGNGHYVNAVFMDGHGATVGRKEWTRKEHWTW
jgi:prepilin-type processing-associated H-X9-DG protein